MLIGANSGATNTGGKVALRQWVGCLGHKKLGFGGATSFSPFCAGTESAFAIPAINQKTWISLAALDPPPRLGYVHPN
jgi:hypothetical protein